MKTRQEAIERYEARKEDLSLQEDRLGWDYSVDLFSRVQRYIEEEEAQGNYDKVCELIEDAYYDIIDDAIELADDVGMFDYSHFDRDAS